MHNYDLESTLRVNLSHFDGRNKKLVECPDHSSYDRFTQFLANYFETDNGRHYFVNNSDIDGLNIIKNILEYKNEVNHNHDMEEEESDDHHDHSSSSDPLDLIYMKKAALHILGLLMADKQYFDAAFLEHNVMNILEQEEMEHREQDQVLLVIASMDCVSLLLKHEAAATWLVCERKFLNSILLGHLSTHRVNNTYIRKTASHLLVSLVMCYLELGESDDILLRIDKDVLQPLYDQHRTSFMDLCFCIMADHTFVEEPKNETKLRDQAVHMMVKSLKLVDRIVKAIISIEDDDSNDATYSSLYRRASDILVMLSKQQVAFDHTRIFEQLLVLPVKESNWWEQLPKITIALNMLQSMSVDHIAVSERVIQSLLVMWRSMVAIEGTEGSNVDVITQVHVMKRGKIIEYIVKSMINIWESLNTSTIVSTIITYISASINEYRHTNETLCAQLLKLLSKMKVKQVDDELANYLNRLFNSTNSSLLYNLAAQILQDTPTYSNVLLRRLYDINWEIRETTLQLMKQYVTTSECSSTMIDAVMKRLVDSESFVRLAAIQVLSIVVPKIGLQDPTPLITILSSTHSSVDNYVHEQVMKTLTDWFVTGVLSWTLLKNQVMSHMAQIADRAYDEFDYEMMRHLLSFYCTAILHSNLSRDDKMLVLTGTHLDKILLDLIQGNITTGNAHDMFVSQICNAMGRSDDSELAMQMIKFCQKKQEPVQEHVATVEYFFTMNDENYDCF
jgi:hypothetical protein